GKEGGSNPMFGKIRVIIFLLAFPLLLLGNYYLMTSGEFSIYSAVAIFFISVSVFMTGIHFAFQKHIPGYYGYYLIFLSLVLGVLFTLALLNP
ncbi:MAG: hypothetical protein AB1652_10530, partial [Bacillota bacterium]